MLVVIYDTRSSTCPGSITSSVVHDNQSNTYNFLDTNVGGGGTACQSYTSGFGGANDGRVTFMYAPTNSNSGSVTITTGTSAAGAYMWAHFIPGANISLSGNPFDKDCGYATTKPAATTSYNTCSIQSTQTNDIFMYFMIMGDNSSCNLNPGSASNGPSVSTKGQSLCVSNFFINFDTNGVIQPSGAPTTFTMAAVGSLDSSGGGTTQLAGLLMTLKPGSAGVASPKHAYIIKNTNRPQPGIIRLSLEND